jgi:hypothetical protein
MTPEGHVRAADSAQTDAEQEADHVS